MLLPFIKMHGLGNDFAVIDSLDRPASFKGEITPEQAIQICDRRFGIGADQVLWLKPPRSPDADLRMEIINSDGTTAEMCGNGIRAAGLYVHGEGIVTRPKIRIETLAGIKTVEVRGENVSVDMEAPKLGGGFPSQGESLRVGSSELRFFEVSMGNPHAVIFVEDFNWLPAGEIGPKIETHPRFPQRTNVEFVKVLSLHEIRVQVWERGAGLTLACGTGACAAAVAAIATGRAKSPLRVSLPGGDLEIEWAGEGRPVIKTGPAEEVFRGIYEHRST